MSLSAPTSPRFTGWWLDQDNGRLRFYYRGTYVGHMTASAFHLESAITGDFDGTMNFDGAADFDSTVDMTGGTPSGVPVVSRVGTSAAVASNGAGAIISDVQFVAPYDLRILSAWAINISASDVTKGTGTTSASYRRFNLVTNTAGTGSGTDIVASLNATASAASLATRSFTTVASTVPAGAIVIGSHLTVGAETADGTDMAARIYEIAYMRV